MTKQLDNTMIRELSADELLLVAGGQEMEREAGRYVTADWGWIGWQVDTETGCGAVGIGNTAWGFCGEYVAVHTVSKR